MDDLYHDSTFDENDDSYEHHDIDLLTGKLRCFRKARATCTVLLHLVNSNKYRSLRLLLLKSKRRYRNLLRRFPNNRIYNGMYGFIERTLIVMYNNQNFDGMKEILEWRIEDIKTKMGRLYVLVNNHVEPNAFADITTQTNTAVNNAANIMNGMRGRGRGRGRGIGF